MKIEIIIKPASKSRGAISKIFHGEDAYKQAMEYIAQAPTTVLKVNVNKNND